MRPLHAVARSLLGGLLAASVSGLLAADPEPPPWRQLYTGADATGENVVALWQFLPGQELRDSSGHGHDLTLRGAARATPEGPLGAALESFPAGTDNDKPQGALAKNHPSLTPPGAFTLECWFAAKPEMTAHGTAFLLDKKYFHYAKDLLEANWDYCLYMDATGPNRRLLKASLGFGKDSAFVSGPEIDVTPGKWTHVAFTYDGAGRCRFFVDGDLASKAVLEGRGPVTPGTRDLVIGDRFGSTHCGFPGFLAQVRISQGIAPGFEGGLTVGPGRARSVFVRMEKGAVLPLVFTNDTATVLTGGSARVVLAGVERLCRLPDLQPNQEHSLPVPIGTDLRPGDYTLTVTASAAGPERAFSAQKDLSITIVPRPLPDQMPVVMWGTGDAERLKRLGFTHHLIGLVDERRVWEAGKPTEAMSPDQVEAQGRMLDDLLRKGLSGAVYVHPGTWVTGEAKRKAAYNRVDRTGAPREAENVCGNFPEIRQFCYNIGASVAQTFGRYPALNAALVHSEVRDASDLCFHEHDHAACRQATGRDIPAEVAGKTGLRYPRIRAFPANRVVRDDDPILAFYRWFWKDGDGWNPLHSEVHRGLQSTGRDDLWTFFDPAVRVPAIWGSGGEVDVISQWTYSYPDPIKIGQATDELFAMARGRPGQEVMKMTQIIWYRSGTAPELPKDETQRAAWEKALPEAQFITIAPDHLREAFWSKLSRPVRGIMYHGWQSLVDTGSRKGYVFTHPDTQEVLAELTRDVVRPLGPTLMQIPDGEMDVALLESAAAQVFAGRGSFGWSESWEADVHLILQWAHLQPRILFDETVRRDGLDGYRVLVLPFCDVLTEGVVARIRDFQKRGGLVVGDEFLCPAITPDIVVPSHKRSRKADEDKAALQAKAAALRQELDAFYSRQVDATDPDVVLRVRPYRNSDYLFVLNDKRTYGNYVGHHGRVMEKGLSSADTLSVRRRVAAVYDLVRHEAVPFRAAGTGTEFDVALGPGDGRVFLLTDQAVGSVRVKVPDRVRCGRAATAEVSVVDLEGKPLAAVVPLQVEVLDAAGHPAEFSGYYGAKDGRLSLRLDLAANDLPGDWTLRARELASGLTAEATLTVAP